MTELLRFRKIYAEDLATGTGTEEVALADGRIAALTKIGINTFAASTDDGQYMLRASTGRFIREHYNVREFGSNPSASGAVNTTAFNDALTAGSIIVPSGTYTIGSKISVPSNRIIYLMAGAVLKAANVAWADTGILDVTDASNVTIFGGGTLDGDKANNATGRIFGVVIHDSTTVRVLGITIQNMPGQDATGINGGDGIIVTGDAAGAGSADILIQGNRLLDNVRQGISLVIGSDIRVLGNAIRGTSGSDPGAGIDIEPNQGTETVRDVAIVGNTFDDNYYHIFVADAGTNVAKNITIANNTMRYARWDSLVVRRQGVAVRGNTLRINTRNGIIVDDTSNVIVQGNTIVGEYATDERRGILVYDTSAVLIHDNNITATRSAGIEVDSSVGGGFAGQGSSDISIKGNVLLDCIVAGGTSPAIRLLSEGIGGRLLERIEVVSNTIRDTRSGGNEADSAVGESGLTAAEITTNDVRDNTISGTTAAYGGNVRTRNHGAAASVSDGGTISHGLGTTPTQVRVTGTVASQILTVTAVAATTFTVAIKTDAGAAGTAQTVYWEAWVN